MTDLRKKPWRKLRVVVEVTVPPNSRARERDLQYLVESSLPATVKLPRPIHADAHPSVIRVKSFAMFWPMFLRAERGIKHFNGRKKESKNG